MSNGVTSKRASIVILAWNEYLLALFLSNVDAQTMPVLVSAQNTTRGPQWWNMSVLIVVMIANIFIQSDALSIVISAVGVLLFAGLTAYDTQKIKSMYAYVQGTDMMGKTAILGALTLYLDFINMFQFLLSFMGNRE